MSMIQISGLTFGYEGSYENVFEDVSLQLDTDWKLGLTGRNGRGKTTLLKLLLGEYEYAGTIAASVDFTYFPRAVPDESLPTLQVLENACPGAEEWRLLREIKRLGLDESLLYRPFSTLSGGEQTKALLAAMFLNENAFLLIDEPTNHLDSEGREQISRYLNSKKGFILVSHDRAVLDGCTDHILSINKTDIEIQKGNFSAWLTDNERREAFEAAENERLKKEMRRLSEAAMTKSVWSEKTERSKKGSFDKGYVGHKSAKLMKRAKTIETRARNAAEEKSKLLKNTEFSGELKLRPLSYRSPRLLSLQDISVAYEDGFPVFGELSFSVGRGERIALTGRNGSGKSSLLKLIRGEAIPYRGSIEKGNDLKISYVSQDTAELTGSVTDYAKRRGIDAGLFVTILHKLDLTQAQLEKNLEEFSGGQKKKALIAGSLCEEAHLYLWDEPMNFIDVISRMQIEELLLKFQPTLLFVEHDRSFSEKIATRTVTIG